jgi:hypothetical protein
LKDEVVLVDTEGKSWAAPQFPEALTKFGKLSGDAQPFFDLYRPFFETAPKPFPLPVSLISNSGRETPLGVDASGPGDCCTRDLGHPAEGEHRAGWCRPEVAARERERVRGGQQGCGGGTRSAGALKRGRLASGASHPAADPLKLVVLLEDTWESARSSTRAAPRREQSAV